MDLLDEGRYNWLHTATHGNFYPGSPDTDSATWHQDMHAFTSDDLVGFAVEDHIKNHRPVFFFNACHGGRGGWALNRIGSWANRLVSAGASFFVGPLWIVSDHTSLTSAEVFYQHLLAGKSLKLYDRED